MRRKSDSGEEACENNSIVRTLKEKITKKRKVIEEQKNQIYKM